MITCPAWAGLHCQGDCPVVPPALEEPFSVGGWPANPHTQFSASPGTSPPYLTYGRVPGPVHLNGFSMIVAVRPPVPSKNDGRVGKTVVGGTVGVATGAAVVVVAGIVVVAAATVVVGAAEVGVNALPLFARFEVATFAFAFFLGEPCAPPGNMTMPDRRTTRNAATRFELRVAVIDDIHRVLSISTLIHQFKAGTPTVAMILRTRSTGTRHQESRGEALH